MKNADVADGWGPLPSLPSHKNPSLPEDARTRAEGEEIPKAIPPEVREQLVAGARLLHPACRERLEQGDWEWLDDEWRLLGKYHQRARCLEAVAKLWFRNPQTGERAHERRKQETERLASSHLTRRSREPETVGDLVAELAGRPSR